MYDIFSPTSSCNGNITVLVLDFKNSSLKPLENSRNRKKIVQLILPNCSKIVDTGIS